MASAETAGRYLFGGEQEQHTAWLLRRAQHRTNYRMDWQEHKLMKQDRSRAKKQQRKQKRGGANLGAEQVERTRIDQAATGAAVPSEEELVEGASETELQQRAEEAQRQEVERSRRLRRL